MTTRDDDMDLLNGFTLLILRKRTALQQEMVSPGFDPDRSDDLVKKLETHVEELREMRQRLEDILAD